MGERNEEEMRGGGHKQKQKGEIQCEKDGRMKKIERKSKQK